MTTIVTPLGEQTIQPGVRWTPVERDEAAGVASRSKLEAGAQQQLIQSAGEILGSGVGPQDTTRTSTGLIVGYVQSGKTLSFTTVMGLARDNGFPLVILIAGNKDNLLTQSTERLARDLNIEGDEGSRAWRLKKNPRAQDEQDEQVVKQTISGWRDPELDDDERATLLITVLKQNQRLQNLTTLLERVDLRGVPVLVVDDEADQASLNTRVRKGEESTTYTRLCELRAALPCHSYLQYTATPQAPLLINIADTLSPDFVRVLEPGPEYVGGSEFFKPGSPYIKRIPSDEISPDDNLPSDPPSSLLEAMRVFFIGFSASLVNSTGRVRRSMLVHPSRARSVHRVSQHWITDAIDGWKNVLKAADGDLDRTELLADFRSAYDELAKTATDLPTFAQVMGKLPRALRSTVAVEFNTNGRPKTPEIKWRDADGWILVGGQAVDRGFTVESLSVTYMPRGTGVGNADTLHQRARFFGYKRRYLSHCRIYLEQDTRIAFQRYVEHEEFMRSELQRLAQTGESLRSWKRRFVLSPDLRPCRNSVIYDDYMRGGRGVKWFQQRGAEMTPAMRSANAGTIAAFVKTLTFRPDTFYKSAEVAQQHLVADNVPLASIVNMLVDYQLEDPRDSASVTGVLLALEAELQRNGNASGVVYRMRPKNKGVLRTVTDDGTLDKGFQQGRTALKGGGTAYPGDDTFKADDRVTIQLHAYDLVRNDTMVARAAPLLAIRVPSGLAKDWLVQHQEGQGSR